MEQKLRSNLTLGLNRDGETLRVALFTLKGTTPSAIALWTLPIEKGNLIDQIGATPTQFGTASQKAIQRALSIAALEGGQLLLRKVELGQIKPSQISAVLPFQAEEQLPYPLDEATLDWLPTTEKEKVTTFAIRNEELEKQLNWWLEHQCDPEQLSAPAAALTAFAASHLSEQPLRLLVHIGAQESSLALIENGMLRSAHSVSSGTTSDHETLSNALSRTAFALKKSLDHKERDQLILTLTGPGSLDATIQATVEEKLALKTEPIEPKAELTSEQLQEWALPIGLALSALETTPSGDQINLRQGPFAFSRPWRHIARPAATFVTLCIAIALLIYAGSCFWATQEIARLRSDYATLVSGIGETVKEAETRYRKKQQLPQLSATQTDEEILSTLTLPDIQARLPAIRDQLGQLGSPIALDAKIPQVRDLLAWLATVPEFAEKKLILDVAEYTLVKRPEKSRQKEHYSTKVTLDFTAQSARDARLFHDKLLEANPFVDAKSEVRWSTSPGKYHVTFMLKDRTRYPSGALS